MAKFTKIVDLKGLTAKVKAATGLLIGRKDGYISSFKKCIMTIIDAVYIEPEEGQSFDPFYSVTILTDSGVRLKSPISGQVSEMFEKLGWIALGEVKDGRLVCHGKAK